MTGIGLHADELFLSVFPEAGGKILELVHTPTGYNLLWQNPRVALRPTYAGAAFDDVWCGGWDEVFPTDPPCDLDGTTYHDHGDLWIGPWEWSVEEDDGKRATLHLRRFSVSLPCLVEKWITVRRESSAVAFRHRLRNLGTQRVSFIWNLHIAHAVEPGTQLHLPAGRLGIHPEYPGRAGDLSEVSSPLFEDAASVTHDLSRVPGPETGITEFFFALDLSDGRCSVWHPSVGAGLDLAFKRDVFTTVWLFGVYGGWRGHYFLLTEPCTSPPGSLADSVASGTAASLDPGEALETEVVATVLGAPP